MAFFLKTLFRKSRLGKYSYEKETGFVPMKEIRSVLIILDGTDPDCPGYEAKAAGFFRSRGVEVSSVFIDLRKYRKDTPVYVSGGNVVLRRHVNWFGMPKLKKKGDLFLKETDLLVNLRDSDDFTGDFISKSAKAGFKIGTCAYQGNPFDLIITGKEETADLPESDCENIAGKHIRERIDIMCKFLNQIV